MSSKQQLEKYLEANPSARERKNKDAAIVTVLMMDFVDLATAATVGKEYFEKVIVNFCKGFSSLDRSWRQILQQRPELRGEDYDKKEVLSQEKQLELGYTPGFHSDVKKGSEL